MDNKKVFDKHFNRLKNEAILKSVLFGSLIGFGVAIAVSAVFWYFGVTAFWLSVVVYAGVTAISSALFYLFKFKPTTRSIALRLDALGLEQRAITMAEYADDNSFIARKQREDTEKALKSLNSRLIKFAVSVPLIIGVSVLCLTGLGTTTVNALAAAGVLPTGQEIVDELTYQPPVYCTVNYVIEGNGVILGESAQVLEAGESATPVLAVAEFGYTFIQWSDGETNPYRRDLNVQKDLLITAQFEYVIGGASDVAAKDVNYGPVDPTKIGDGDGNGDQFGGGGTNFIDLPDPPDKDPGAANTSSEPANQVFDGNTYYGGDICNEYSNNETSEATNDPNLSDGEKSFLSSYYSGIQQ